MSTTNAELTNQDNQDNEKKGRNPAILIGGLVLLVGAFVILIFGGGLFGDNSQALDQVALEEQHRTPRTKLDPT